MPLAVRGYARSIVRLAAVGAVFIPVLTLAAGGAVTSSTTEHDFVVDGTTPSAIVHYMDSHAVSGDHGHAYANIHPNYQLSLTTHQAGDMCVPSDVDVHVDFDLTLPVAADVAGMSGRTRWAWNDFAAFARAHEGHHKASYLACAAAFVAQARRQSAAECFALEENIRQMLYEMKQNCEAAQAPFDRAQRWPLVHQPLLEMAGR